VDRTSFTAMMMDVDNMSDTQLTVLYAYVRDTRQNRATERAMRRRALQNAPTPPPTAPKTDAAHK
jgi:hypothetical protein